MIKCMTQKFFLTVQFFNLTLEFKNRVIIRMN